MAVCHAPGLVPFRIWALWVAAIWVRGLAGLVGVVGEDGDCAALAGTGNFGAVQARVFVGSYGIYDLVGLGVAQHGVMCVGVMGGVHEVAGFVKEECSGRACGIERGGLLGFEDVMVDGFLDLVGD